MGIPTSEVGYTSATTGREDHEVHKGHVVALEGGKIFTVYVYVSPFNDLCLVKNCEIGYSYLTT
jgi:hypothetical protein